MNGPVKLLTFWKYSVMAFWHSLTSNLRILNNFRNNNDWHLKL